MSKQKQYAEYMEVTQTLAVAWLEKNTINRAIKDPHVQAITEAIRQGTFRGDNGETIKISPEGKVLDGQHRLWAVVEANHSIRTWVVFNVPEDSFPTIDLVIPRSANDAITVEGKTTGQEFLYGSILSAAAKYYYRYLHEGLKDMLINVGSERRRVSNQEVLEVIRNHQEIVDSSIFIGPLRYVKGIKKSKFIFLHTILAKKDTSMANHFMEKLYTGEDLAKGSPILTLRNKLLNLKQTTGLINGHRLDLFLIVITIKAWNAYREGRKAQVLSWGETEAPPTVK